MAKKLIFGVGFDLPDVEGFEPLALTSDRSLLDADVIAVEPTLDDFHCDDQYDGLPLMNKASSFRYRDIRQRWLSQIDAALMAGKTVIFFLTERKSMFYHTGERQVSGTGRGQRVTNIVSMASNYDFLPAKLKNPNYARGHTIVLDLGAGIAAPFWDQFGARMEVQLLIPT